MFELKRIFCRKKLWLILVLVTVLNLALFAGFCRAEEENRINNPYLDEAEQTAAYLDGGYAEYLTYVSTQSQSQSILSGLGKQSSFVTRNLERTAADYRKLTDIRLEDGENRGIQAIFGFSVTDYLLLIAPLLLVLELVAERKSACGDLTRTTRKGRLHLTLLRAFALLLLSAVSVLLLFGGDICYSCGFFGDPDFPRSLQSIPDFQLCAVKVSIGEYLITAACMKTAAVFLLALTAWLVLSICQSVLAFLILLLVVGGQFLCFHLIVPTASFCHLKFCSVVAFLQAHTFFLRYCNLNVFGKPVGFMAAAIVVTMTALLLMIVLCAVCIGICRPISIGSVAENVKNSVSKRFSRFKRRRSLLGYEGRKLLISEGGILVLIVTIFYGFTLFSDMQVLDPVSWEMKTIYQTYEGEITDEKIEKTEDRIEKLKRTLKTQQEQLATRIANKPDDTWGIIEIEGRISQTEQSIQHYTELWDSFNELREYTQKSGLDAWYVCDAGYRLLFCDSAAERRCCMTLLLFLVFMFAPMIAYENKYDATTMLRSTKRGRGAMTRCKLFWVILFTVIGAMGLHGIFFWKVWKNVGFSLPNAPAQSLRMFRFLPFAVSLKACIIGLFVLRLAAALALGLLVLLVSKRSRNPQTALLAALVIFLLPTALSETGITLLDPLNFAKLLSVVR